MTRPYAHKCAIDPDELRAAAPFCSATQLAAQFGVGYERIERELAALNLTARQREPKTQPRTCLKCRQTFSSKGPGNRLCPKCRDINSRLGHSLGH